MSDVSPVPINFKEANNYADLEGIKQDLLWVIEAANKYSEIDIRDTITKEAFTFAILIKYRRANTSGERRRIPKQWIDELSDDDQNDHHKFMALGNKYIAHSVNDFEENYAQVRIKNNASGQPEFDQISVMHTRVTSIGVDGISRLVCLSKALITKIELQMKKEKCRVEEIAKGIPIDCLKKHKYTRFFLSGKNNVFNSRRRRIIKQ
ncbi:MAG: hypothetical protein PHC29_08685 [Candidatus Omnitrophica bacterium]|nr:hypothetical protein [Candidatus Omnitrophota bacterium]